MLLCPLGGMGTEQLRCSFCATFSLCQCLKEIHRCEHVCAHTRRDNPVTNKDPPARWSPDTISASHQGEGRAQGPASQAPCRFQETELRPRLLGVLPGVPPSLTSSPSAPTSAAAPRPPGRNNASHPPPRSRPARPHSSDPGAPEGSGGPSGSPCISRHTAPTRGSTQGGCSVGVRRARPTLPHAVCGEGCGFRENALPSPPEGGKHLQMAKTATSADNSVLSLWGRCKSPRLAPKGTGAFWGLWSCLSAAHWVLGGLSGQHLLLSEHICFELQPRGAQQSWTVGGLGRRACRAPQGPRAPKKAPSLTPTVTWPCSTHTLLQRGSAPLSWPSRSRARNTGPLPEGCLRRCVY